MLSKIYKKECPKCEGWGFLKSKDGKSRDIRNTCEDCKGKGVIKSGRKNIRKPSTKESA